MPRKIIADEKEASRDAAIEAMVITEEEANKFIQKVTGLSNKHARKIALDQLAYPLPSSEISSAYPLYAYPQPY